MDIVKLIHLWNLVMKSSSRIHQKLGVTVFGLRSIQHTLISVLKLFLVFTITTALDSACDYSGTVSQDAAVDGDEQADGVSDAGTDAGTDGSTGDDGGGTVASVVLYFSDLTDGPVSGWEGSSTKGAAVSIWGRNFGAERGASFVTVGGVDLTSDSDYAEWGATDNPTVPLGMQRITFWLNSDMLTGGSYPNTTITVTTPSGTSSSISFHTRTLGNNHIYFVDNANGSASGDGLSLATAKRYLYWFRENAVAGDILYVKGSGIKYTDHDNDSENYMFAYGGLFTFSKLYSGKNFHNGRAGQSITVSAYPGDDVQLEAIGDDTTYPSQVVKWIYTSLEYWTFSKFTINAHYPINDIDDVSPPYSSSSSNLRFINLDITTPYYDNTRNSGHVSSGQGMVISGGKGSDHLYVLGCYLHDISMDYRGQPPFDPDGYRSYFMYFNGYGVFDELELGWNEMAWVNSRGVQFFGHHGDDRMNHVRVHDNWIHDTGRQNLVFGGEGGANDYSFIQDAYIYNNILSNGGEADVVLQMGGSYGNGKYGGNYYVYNNVLDASNNVDYPSIHIGKELDSLTMKNNIILGTTNTWDYYTYFPDTYEEFISDLTPDASNNLYYGAGASKKPDWDSSALDDVTPQFINETPGSFLEWQLEQTSPAVDAGASLSTVATDFLGVPRPQGSAYDIGAYEYLENETGH